MDVVVDRLVGQKRSAPNSPPATQVDDETKVKVDKRTTAILNMEGSLLLGMRQRDLSKFNANCKRKELVGSVVQWDALGMETIPRRS